MGNVARYKWDVASLSYLAVAFAGGVLNGAVTIKKRGNRGRITNAGFKTRWILKKSDSKASISPNNTTNPASCSWRYRYRIKSRTRFHTREAFDIP